MSNPMRDTLNSHKWRTGDLDRIVLVVRHRGAPNDEERISGSEIAEILAEGVQLAGEDGAFIPYHRILEIRE
jgi:uncharacterized protein (UPF0248 family)